MSVVSLLGIISLTLSGHPEMLYFKLSLGRDYCHISLKCINVNLLYFFTKVFSGKLTQWRWMPYKLFLLGV